MGVAIERTGAAETEHLLASFQPPGGSRTGKGWSRLSGGAAAGQDGPTSLYDLANGSGVSVEDLGFGVGSPEQASGFVQGCGRARSGGGSVKVFGEHRFSVRAEGQPAEGKSIVGKALPLLQIGLATIQIFRGVSELRALNIPRLCRDTGPPSRRVLCF